MELWLGSVLCKVTVSVCVRVCVWRESGDVGAVWVVACVCGGGGGYMCIEGGGVGGGVGFLFGILDVLVIGVSSFWVAHFFFEKLNKC